MISDVVEKNVKKISEFSLNKEVNIAYLILVHRFPEQFKTLFKSIYEQNNYYLIHIDKNSDISLHDEIKYFIKDYKNTYIMESENIVWGGYSIVNVELNGIKKLLELGLNWDFFINLSGQDFPLKTQQYIREFLIKNKDNNFLKVSNQLKERPDTMNRVENYFKDNGKSVVEIKDKKRKFIKDAIPYIGGQWMILSRKCCEFIFNSHESKKYEDFYKNTLIADESFFQTFLMNSSFKGNIINDDMRAIIWIPDGSIKLRPKTFTRDDIKFLLSKDNLFARKFDNVIDTDVINLIKSSFKLKISN